MNPPSHTWQSFKAFIDHQVAGNVHALYRGQSDTSWGLVSTYHRLSAPGDPSYYWQVLTLVHDYVSTWVGRSWNLENTFDYASFLGFLQHNGFPTPLLDWTRSPYMAAFFAFAGVDDEKPQSDNVAIFSFDSAHWISHWRQILDSKVADPHVSLLNSQTRGNQKQLLQQGAYTYSTVIDQEKHINLLAQKHSEDHSTETRYLTKLTISVHEKPVAMRDLRLMGISSLTLFPGVDGVCRHLRDMLFPAERIGLSPSEREQVLLDALREVRQDKQVGAGEKPTMGAENQQTASNDTTSIRKDA